MRVVTCDRASRRSVDDLLRPRCRRPAKQSQSSVAVGVQVKLWMVYAVLIGKERSKMKDRSARDAKRIFFFDVRNIMFD